MSTRTALFLACLTGGCGARSELSDLSEARSSGASGMNDACPSAPNGVATPIKMVIEDPGNIATSGCDFAATWIDNRSGHLFVDATVFHVVDGAWKDTGITTFAEVVHDNNAFIAWDGSAYTVMWTDGALFIRRMSPAGTLIGPAVRSFDVHSDADIHWLDRADDASWRMGWLDDQSKQFHYAPYYSHVADDGQVIVPETALSGLMEDAFDLSFIRLPDGSNRLLLSEMPSQTARVTLVSFSDQGDVEGTSMIATEGEISGAKVGLLGNELYVSLWNGEHPKLNLEALSPSGEPTPIPGLRGGYEPAMATTSSGELGVLSSATPEGGELFLTIVEDSQVKRSEVVMRGLSNSFSYAMAGGTSAFGVVLMTDGEVSFKVVTP